MTKEVIQHLARALEDAQQILQETTDQEDLYLICEEEESGIEEGCSPWPWMPCVYPPGNSKKTYSVTRRWYSHAPLTLSKKCENCA